MGGGGPSTTTTTVDKKYNAGMLELSQEQQGWAREMYNMFKYGVTYDPSEQVQVDANGNIVLNTQNTAGTNKTNAPDYTGPYYGSGGLENPADRPGYVANADTEYGQTPQQTEIPGGQTASGINTTTPTPTTTTTLGELKGYDPNAQISEMQYLQNLVEANAGLLGLQTEASKADLQLSAETANANRELLPYQTESTKTGLQYQTGLNTARSNLLPGQTELAQKGIDFSSKFIDEAGKGVDTNAWMNEAQAGVQHGFKLANEELRRDISSYGLDPSSGRYTSQNRAMKTAEAAGVAGARTQAQRAAEQEDFRRKQVAAQGLTIPTI